MPSSINRLDAVYRKILLTRFFTKGWGPPEDLMRLFRFRRVVANRASCYSLVPPDYPIKIINATKHAGFQIIEGCFQSPVDLYLRDSLAPEIKQVFFQMVLPKKWPSPDFRPLCIHLAGTGDHYFWRRRTLMAKPLLQQGIGSIILENPYYGLRKPANQVRSSVHYVSDIFFMGACLIFECIVLLNWAETLGFGPLGITGISMGGHMASLAASSWPKPLVLVPCLSWSTASSVFTEGVMSEAIDWDNLQKQFLSNPIYHDILSNACKIVDSPLACTLSRIPGCFLECWLPSKTFTHDVVDFPEYGLTSLMETNHNLQYVSPSTIIHKSANISGTQNVKANAADSFVKLYASRSKQANEMKKRNRESVWFMRGLMDEFTHLKNFSVPYDPSLIISVCAKSDGYVPRIGISNLEEIWPGATVKYIDTGHVGAYIWHRKVFRDSIVEAFELAKKKVQPPGPYFEI